MAFQDLGEEKEEVQSEDASSVEKVAIFRKTALTVIRRSDQEAIVFIQPWRIAYLLYTVQDGYQEV